MAQFGSYATTGSNVVVDAAARTLTISSEVVEIDGLLDPPTGFDDWGGWTITCTSSGGFRSIAGASGTLGGGAQSLKIIESSNAHRFGADNFSANNTGVTARFAGDSTNAMKYHNIVWLVMPGGRSDFDIARGSQSNGSAGPAVEMSGVRLHQLTTSDQTAHFNHFSGNASIRLHDRVGFGLSIRNETNGPAIEFSTKIQAGKVVEGLVIDNVASPTNNSSGARCAVRLTPISTNGTMTLSNLDTPSIAAVNGTATKNLLLVDPVGRPTRRDWGNQYHGNFEIERTVPFVFTGAPVPAGTTMTAITQSAGENATATMSGSAGSIRVRTDYSANNASGGAWTAQNTYRFFMPSVGLRKYASSATVTISNRPTAITAALTADELPDGSSISSVSVPAECSDLSDVIRLVKSWETSNPNLSPAASLGYIEGTSVKINAGYSVVLSSSASESIGVSGSTVTIKCSSTLSASNGLTTLDASGASKTITTSGVTAADNVFLLDSTGQKSVVSITNSTGASTLFSVVKVSDLTITGSATIASGSTGSITITTTGLSSGYKVVGKRQGFDYFSADADLTGGGSRSFTASLPSGILQPDGSASYSTTAITTGLSVADASSGSTPRMRVGVGNSTFSAVACFKAIEDFLAGPSGAVFMSLGGQQPTFIQDRIKGDQIYLGAHCKVKRQSSENSNATIRASLFSNDEQPVDDANGDIQTVEGLNIPTLGTALLVNLDFDAGAAGTQSIVSKIDSIRTAIDGVADNVWNADLDPGLSGTQDIRGAIRQVNSLLGSNFVESGYSLKDALRIVLAVLVGRLNVTNEGRTLTFHRVDAGETAAIRGDVSDLGRSAPTRDPD